MYNFRLLRKLYGDVYATQLSDGHFVTWKPLSVQEYLNYEFQYVREVYTKGYLEDEIFCKCVLDQYYINNIDKLNAGTVATVVAAIMLISGPNGVEGLDRDFQNARIEANNNLIQQLAVIIIQAFPAYKMEEILALDYPVFMLRAAQAETALLKVGFIKEPLTFVPMEKMTKPKKDTSQLKKRFEKQEKEDIPMNSITKKTVISSADMEEHASVYTGHEKEDRIINEHKMLKETTEIYKDYLQQKRTNGEISIKTHEERVEDAYKLLDRQKHLLKKRPKKKESKEERLERLIKRATKKRR